MGSISSSSTRTSFNLLLIYFLLNMLDKFSNQKDDTSQTFEVLVFIKRYIIK